MTIKVLCAVPQVHEAVHPVLERLRAADCELTFNQTGHTLTEPELIGLLPGVFGTIAGGEPYTERVFAAAPDLEVVARMGVGYDKVDVAAATRHGVAIAMGFGTNHEAVADHAFALIAALGNRLPSYHGEVMDGRWGGHFHPGLWRTAVGIIGLGRIGRALARRCRGFEMRILAYDAVPDPAYARAHGIELVDLETVFKEADFVSVHAPLTGASAKIVSREQLALMRPSAFLINTARGGLVDEAALHEALSAGRIAGAGLDVFEVEPLPASSPLRQLDNVLLSPHCAGGSIEAVVAMTDRCVDNILAIRDRRRPAGGILNPETLAG
jgi:D-3-phosphoglycerate dehydrogenase / 2-oxoglutarate reductase